MAHTEQQLQDFMDQISDDPRTSFKMLLHVGDLSEAFESDDDWAGLCEFAMKIEETRDESMPFMLRYKQAMEKGGFDGMLTAINSDMQDNEIFAAIGLHRFGVAKNLRFIPEAACNKHSFEGLHGEFALVRFLHWSGFNINAVDAQTGMSALHYFASVTYPPYAHNRAVDWLLEHGANPDVQNAEGDTPLTYMSGNNKWSDELTACMVSLIKAGANPFLESEDGSTTLSLLKEGNASNPHEGRTLVIDMLEAIIAVGEDMQEDDSDDSDDEQSESDESVLEAGDKPVAASQVTNESDAAKPVQSSEVEQPSQRAEQKIQQVESAKTVSAMTPIDFDAVMKLQGVAWGNDGKPVKVSMGDK